MSALNFNQARFNMVHNQVRPWEVLDPSVLHSMETLPRDAFVPIEYRNLAYADISIPLAQGQSMLSPKVEARIVQALLLDAGDRVLQVGTGSGYLAALLSQLCNHLDSVELYTELAEQAQANLAVHNIRNVNIKVGDAVHGWNKEYHYDAIVLGSSLPVYQRFWQEQLAVGGRLFVIIGQAPVMQAKLITRVSNNEWLTDGLFETVVPAMVGAQQPSAFVL